MDSSRSHVHQGIEDESQDRWDRLNSPLVFIGFLFAPHTLRSPRVTAEYFLDLGNPQG